ncbi:MAG: TadE/TadG family type IV pilus assembly protein [Hyphomicrobiales bacterium]
MRRARLGEDGVSAVEFGLIAPILFVSLLAMVDVGFAISERMSLDSVLRAGAQEAMDDPGEADMQAALDAIAAENFAADAMPVFNVAVRCDCPAQPGEYLADCTVPTDCEPGPTATSIYYHLEGTKTYDGIFMTIDLGPSVQVQVR